jgi:micrococcal nuclease
MRYLPLVIPLVLLLSPERSEADPDQQRQRCHPSYPDFCIPPPPPDLNCPDIRRYNFRVLPPDPHGFDRDRDGIGCERR